MPAGFAMIEEYNSLKQQIIEEDDRNFTDQKVPQFKAGPTEACYLNAIKVPHGLPQNFLSNLQNGDLFLEELAPFQQNATNWAPSSTTTTTTTTTTSSTLVTSSPSVSQAQTSQELDSFDSMSGPLDQYLSMAATSGSTGTFNGATTSPPTSTPSNFVNLVAGGGCTFSEVSSYQQRQPLVRGHTPDHQQAPSPTGNLYDLDKHNSPSLYDDTHNAVAVKSEPKAYCDDPQIFGEYCYPNEDCGFFMHETNVNVALENYIDYPADLYNTANELNISINPIEWSYTDTQRWVRYQISRPPWVDQNIDEDNLVLFNVKGTSLMVMTEQDFVWRSPEAGYSLYWELRRWADAAKALPRPKLTAPYGMDNEPINTDHTRKWPPSISPAPSVDSSCSTLSSSSANLSTSPYGHFSHDSTDDDVFQSGAGRGLSQPFRQHQTTLPITAAPTSNTSSLPRTGRQGGKQQVIHLWQFLKELLEEPDSYHACIRWTDRARGIFKIEDSSKVARLWGRRKNRPAMNYDKLSRSVRQYYKKGIIKKTEHSKRLVYQFCPNYL